MNKCDSPLIVAPCHASECPSRLGYLHLYFGAVSVSASFTGDAVQHFCGRGKTVIYNGNDLNSPCLTWSLSLTITNAGCWSGQMGKLSFSDLFLVLTVLVSTLLLLQAKEVSLNKMTWHRFYYTDSFIDSSPHKGEDIGHCCMDMLSSSNTLTRAWWAIVPSLS